MNKTQYFAAVGEHPELFTIGPCATVEEAVDKCAKDYLISMESEAPALLPDGLKISAGNDDRFIPLIFWGNIEERLRDDAYEHCGDAADLWALKTTHEQCHRLETALNYVLHGWLHEIDEWPTCFSIQNVKVFSWNKSDEKWVAL